MTEYCKIPGCPANGAGIIEMGYCQTCWGVPTNLSAHHKSDLLSSMAEAAAQSEPPASISVPVPAVQLAERPRLGAGLVAIESVPMRELKDVLLSAPELPEKKRTCPNPDCGHRVHRKRAKGYCGLCGEEFDYTMRLKTGDILHDRYEILGVVAHGGVCAVYGGFDRKLKRSVIIKGILNGKDKDSAEVLQREGAYLADMKHPNIVQVHDCVIHNGEFFIVMDYVPAINLKDLRAEFGGPLPVNVGVAATLGMLEIISYVHKVKGKLWCDWKADNVMFGRRDISAVDITAVDGGALREDGDMSGPFWYTEGYTPPEGGALPSIQSVLFTVAKTLMILIMNFDFLDKYKFEVPPPSESQVMAQHPSLYRFLDKATSKNPADRFQDADDMYRQLEGVLHEIVAADGHPSAPAYGTIFGGDQSATANPCAQTPHEFAQLLPRVHMVADPFNHTAVPAAPDTVADAAQRIDKLIDAGTFDQVEAELDGLKSTSPNDLRLLWLMAKSLLAQGKGKEAFDIFDQIYSELPGELAVKLMLALAADSTGDYPKALAYYQLVLRTNGEYTTALFGQARCLMNQGTVTKALDIYLQVPSTSNPYEQQQAHVISIAGSQMEIPVTSHYQRAQLQIISMLVDATNHKPSHQDLIRANDMVEVLKLDPPAAIKLKAALRLGAADLVKRGLLSTLKQVKMSECPFTEYDLRLGASRLFDILADQYATTRQEFDDYRRQADRSSPKTWALLG